MKKLNSKEAELIGMHIGDGTLYKTNRGVVWELRGGLNEKEYYLNHVKPLLESIFNEIFTPKFRSGGKNGCFGIQTSKRIVIDFFLKFWFKPGTKTYTVRIPTYIMDSSKKIKYSFIRGLFDTDGCLRFDKNHGLIKKYPKLEFGFASKQLILDLSELLKELDFMNHRWVDGTSYKLCVPGREMLKKWFQLIRPGNAKHLNKNLIFQRLGYYVEVAQSGTA